MFVESEAEIKSALKSLDSKNSYIRIQAISELGNWKREEVTSALLACLSKNIKKNTGYKESILCTSPQPEMRTYIRVAPENETLGDALSKHGAKKALPLLKKALVFEMRKDEDERSPRATKGYASSIYELSGQCLKFFNNELKIEIYQPYPIQEEKTRMFLRPDLKPTYGLTAALQVEKTEFVIASKSLKLQLQLVNHTAKAIPIDLSMKSFVISITTIERADFPATQLPVSIIDQHQKTILPQKTITLTWEIKRVKDSVFHESLGTGGFYIKAIYRPNDKALQKEWQNSSLVSNTVEGYYFPYE